MENKTENISKLQYKGFFADILIILTACAGLWFLIIQIDLIGWLEYSLGISESFDIDNVIIGLFILAFGLLLLGISRWRYLNKGISLLIKKERILKNSEERFKLLINSLEDIVFTVDRRIRFTSLYGNRFKTLENSTPGILLKKTPRQIFGEEDAAIHEESIKRALNGETVTYEVPVQTNGKPHQYKFTVSPIRNDRKNINGAVGAGHNISYQTEFDGDLYRHEKELRALLENTPDIIAQYDNEGRYVYANNAFETVIGTIRDHVVGKKFTEVSIPVELVPFWHNEIVSVIEDGKEKTIEAEMATPNGIKYYQARLVPELNEEKQVEYVLVVARDLTKFKKTENELRRSEENLERILQTNPGGVTIIDLNGRIFFANQLAEQLLDLNRKNSEERYYNDPAYKISTVDGKPLPDKDLPYIQVMMSGMPVFGLEHAIEHPDGRKIYLSVNAAPLLDYNNRITAIITSLTDITKLKIAEQEREKLIYELKDALYKVKTLSGLLPICAFCKNIRDDGGYWHQVEAYIKTHSEANFSHGVCPDCAKEHYPEYFKDNDIKEESK